MVVVNEGMNYFHYVNGDYGKFNVFLQSICERLAFMTDGLVSIITSIYNSSKYICRTMDSVLGQTYGNWEMIITDDCSDDDGPQKVMEYAARDRRIKFYTLSENSGPGIARNNSISKANGRYIAFLDSDDVWLPGKLEAQLALMKEKDCAVVYSSYLKSDENNKITGLVRCRQSVTYRRMVCDNAIGFLTMMFDRSKTGDMYLPTIRKRQDWGLNIMLLKKCRIAYGILEPMAIYNVRSNSVSRDKLSLVKYNIGIYREILGFSGICSLLMFLFVFMPSYCGKKILNFIRTISC